MEEGGGGERFQEGDDWNKLLPFYKLLKLLLRPSTITHKVLLSTCVDAGRPVKSAGVNHRGREEAPAKGAPALKDPLPWKKQQPQNLKQQRQKKVDPRLN